MRRGVVAVSLLLAIAGLAGCRTQPPARAGLQPRVDAYLQSLPAHWGAMSAGELSQQIRTAKPFLLDVRDAAEIRNEGHIAGSVIVPVRTLLRNLDRLPGKHDAIVVICSSGHRSALAMAALQMLGYTNVKALVGGMHTWKAAKLPVDTGTPPGADRLTALRRWVSQYLPSSDTPASSDELFTALDSYLSVLPNSLDTLPPPMVQDLLSSSRPLQLDVREPAEIASSGAIDGATAVPLRSLLRRLDQLPPDRHALIITECADGHRAAVAMLALRVLGYSNVKTLLGGVDGWTKAGLQVTPKST